MGVECIPGRPPRFTGCAWPEGCKAPKAGVFLCEKHLQAIGVMETNRFKVMVTLSSDHAGIGLEIRRLELELRRVFARIEDARKARDYIAYLVNESREFCDANQIDMRSWYERTHKKRA